MHPSCYYALPPIRGEPSRMRRLFSWEGGLSRRCMDE
nr:MAG TPA: hypothetical protein [Caudoviricetes sp.]DAS04185.1 MAG TPA: hypothetical protein [Caudoviricetes sp.]